MTAAVKTDQLMQKLIMLHQSMKPDEENAHKLVELGNKYANDKLFVAFAGHFSAGKSSMINKLLNEQVLPTSPIPTSANLVLLEKGLEQVALISKDKERIELSIDYSLEQIKEYCKQGEEIERVYIKRPYHNLNENVVIMDTPGIDSTDAAHKLSTESMLHIADVIFYVTDYNHVQSEENVAFVKEMKDKDKILFLIVNQIDKHVESEVSFTNFKTQIEGTFSESGLHYQDIFYTTLFEDDHEHNQLAEVQNIIRVVINNKEDYLEKNVKNSLEQLVLDHIDKYKDQSGLSEFTKPEIQSSLDDYRQKSNSLRNQLDEKQQKLKDILTEINERVSAILKGANIIPYETREKVASYIEAIDPAFKKGFLFSKTKTEQEREKRKKELFEQLKKNVETQITWHFVTLFNEYIKEYEVNDDLLLQKIQTFSILLTDQIVEEAYKPGASFNGQYILTYSSDVSELIKKICKKEIMAVFEQFINLISVDIRDEINKLSSNLETLAEKCMYYEKIIAEFEQLVSYEASLLNLLNNQTNENYNSDQWLLENQLYTNRLMNTIVVDKQLDTAVRGEMINSDSHVKEIGNKDQFINETGKVISQLKQMRGFNQFTDSLESKVNSYRNRAFTVALFGAFSAGKSSFANALIGERILPSSPTPTTATINKIAPTTSDKKHGLVEVKLKREDILINEVVNSFSSLENKMFTISELVDELKKIDVHDQNEKKSQKKYSEALKVYLQLVNNGLLLSTTKDKLEDFVTIEEKACLVEEVIIYFDCPLTKAGITLVDTPGADSLHKRHTDVAFQYIKKADAILYVTYYNHPFSKGDREFLRQLGRVKDSFTLDKMFFIINAIDLAKDEQEVKLVKDYISDQLKKQEIRNIRLYGVSSMEILANKIDAESEYIEFKHQFDYFIKQELTNTMIASISEDLKRSNERVETLINAAAKDEVEKAEIKLILIEESKNVNKELSAITKIRLVNNVKKEIEELIFYVKQRLVLRFYEFFKESFHPSLFNQQNSHSQALIVCLNDLLASIEFELVQELQATTLRIEGFIKKVLEDEYLRITQLVKKNSKSITLSKPNHQGIQTPNITVDITMEMTSYLKPSLKMFKNTKSFFEKNEKKMMSDDLQNRLDQPLSHTLEQYLNDFLVYYEDVISGMHANLIKMIRLQTEEEFESLLDIQAEDTKHLKQVQSQLETVIKILNI